MAQEEIELVQCELCGKDTDVSRAHHTDNGWWCEACDAKWREHFNACAHAWKEDHSEFGDEGFVCTKCLGFVRAADWKSLFGCDSPRPSPRSGGGE